MKKNPEIFIDRFEAIQKIGIKVDIPWDVWTTLGNPEAPKIIEVVADEISLCGCDNKPVSKAREALEWYVRQLGGTVTWRQDGLSEK